ncbi:DUF1499 domain-containing protein [uncultured Piscinibacter sp.]|uniref:DUF1499 domain-containing protein n=1 Tax=uncultured Piscinibacter sp. TaxID=1131835 RepID=UPI00261105B9|nr:DUF1499 domain-containing protein [uncultured Piscinibacter sp.]
MAILKSTLLVLLLLAVAVALAAQLGLLRGRMPADLGARDGRLKPPSMTPNSVSSQAHLYHDHPQRGYAQIDPVTVTDSGPQTLERLRRIVEGMEGAKVVRSDPGYLHVEFTSRWMKFVDDCEFWFDPRAGVIHVRSASRMGRKDFGVNRARVEAIRARLAT